MVKSYDFGGWATRANLRCSDGRTILPDAFKHMDGKTVPLVWNHKHDDPSEILGQAYLEHREGEGVYAYCTFNDTESGETAKKLVKHGDITSLSIFANNLKQQLSTVLHGNIREVSLVLAGANPGAFIENVMLHSDDGEFVDIIEDQAYIFPNEALEFKHSEEVSNEDIQHSEDSEDSKDSEKEDEEDDETIQDVIDSMNEKQQTVFYAMVGEMAGLKADEKDVEHSDADDNIIEHSEGGESIMKQNAFDTNVSNQENNLTLTHADEMAIIDLAKKSNVGSFKEALATYVEENDQLAHGIFEDYSVLFPEYELLKKGEPETIEKYDQTWVGPTLRKIHKSPFSRIRTRYADARIAELKAKGYQNKGDQKTVMNQIKMIGRTTDPQTVYIKDNMHRDDIIDITDFSVVEYQWKMMRRVLDETLALAALVGDGREEGDPDKIHETHIRSIWNDDEEYTIHKDVDIAAARLELQGTDTGANFGENYIYAEAIITAALYAREQFKGTGTPDFYCTPHLVNVMLLARDLNGRRIYDSKADLAKALNVGSIVEVEQFEGKVRTTEAGDKKKLLGLFVNMNDYQFGSTKGGEITRFEDFDMDFNVQKFMLETRLSGSLTRLKAAIALEEPIEDGAQG